MSCVNSDITFGGRVALEILGAGPVMGSQWEELQTVCYMNGGNKGSTCEITES